MNKVELDKIQFLIDKYKKIQQQDKPFKAFRNTPERILVDIIKDLNELLRSAEKLNQAADAVSELMAENAELREAQRWRLVKDEPPESGVRVIIFQECGFVGIAKIEKGGWHWYDDEWSKLNDPIYWMPLPDPPQKEE